MIGFRLLCRDTECDGCHCHLSAPCNHCVEHWIDGPPSRVLKSASRVLKSGDPNCWIGFWIGICYLPGCDLSNPFQDGDRICSGDDFSTVFYYTEKHVQWHIDQIGA
jgi:hypothetical protein